MEIFYFNINKEVSIESLGLSETEVVVCFYYTKIEVGAGVEVKKPYYCGTIGVVSLPYLNFIVVPRIIKEIVLIINIFIRKAPFKFLRKYKNWSLN